MKYSLILKSRMSGEVISEIMLFSFPDYDQATTCMGLIYHPEKKTSYKDFYQEVSATLNKLFNEVLTHDVVIRADF